MVAKILAVLSFLILICQCMTMAGYSQDTIHGSNDKILLVGFRPDLFFNDGSAEMIPASEMDYDQMVNYFRLSLDEALVAAISDSAVVYSLTSSYIQGSSEELTTVYENANYKLETLPASEPGNKTYLPVSRLVNNEKAKKKKPEPRKGELVSEVSTIHDKYLCVWFHDFSSIQKIAAKHNCNSILFINQFEIVGDYSDRMKVVEHSYNRIIKVHYSILTSEGNLLYGSIASHEFHSAENQIQKICGSYFPIIAREILLMLMEVGKK